MADIEVLLEARASKLAPTQTQLQAAARSHGHLRAVLATGNMDYRIQTSYLSGSYARQTAVRPLDDVDVVFEIDPSLWRRNPLQRLLYRFPDPSKVLETFARAIRHRYPNSRVQTQRRSVGLVMEHLHIDVVPAVADPERPDWLRIPNTATGAWISTAPRVHSQLAIRLNKSSGGRFKPMVRLLKGWNAGLPATQRLKSFAVETLAARFFQAHALNSFSDGAFYFFDFVAWRGRRHALANWNDTLDVDLGGWSGRLPDLAGTGSDLLAGCERARRRAFTEAARVARDAFVAASKARTEKTAWRHVDRRLRAGNARL